MKIKLFNKELHLYRKFHTSDKIISLGTDCHAAYVLNGLKFRTISFPFDWLFSNSIKGLKLVNENIKHNFQFFLADLEINERNYIISKHYPYTEFFHEKNLIENESDRSRLKNRANKFLNYIDKNSCTFLYVINHDHIKNEDDINEFIL